VAENFTISGGTFNDNSGTVKMDGSGNRTINIGSTNLNNFTIQKGNRDVTVSGTVNVAGDFLITSADEIRNGTIAVSGDAASTDTSVRGSGRIRMTGTADHALGGLSAPFGEFPAIIINKSGGTLTLRNSILVRDNWTYTAGTVVAGTSTVVFSGNNSKTVSSGSMIFNNVELDMSSRDLTVTGTMDVDGNLVITRVDDIRNGTILVAGNASSTDTSVKGSGRIKMDGGNNQFLGGTAAPFGQFPEIEIDKSGGTLTLRNTILVRDDWIYTAGTVDPGTSTVQFSGGGNKTVDVGSTSFNNLILDMGGSRLTVNNTVDVIGDFTINRVGNINSGTIAVNGNLDSQDGSLGGSGTIKLDSTGTQTITAGSNDEFPFIEIDKTSGTASLGSAARFDRGFTITNGSFDMGSNNNLRINQTTTIASGGTFSNTGSGDLTLGGNVTNNGTVSFDSGGSGSSSDTIRTRSIIQFEIKDGGGASEVPVHIVPGIGAGDRSNRARRTIGPLTLDINIHKGKGPCS